MKLDKISYSELDTLPKEWRIDNMVLRDVNLIVGKNASGKSRALWVTNMLASLLAGSMKPNIYSGSWDASFSDGNNTMQYLLQVANGKIVRELFSVNGDEKLTRGDGGVGSIYTTQLDRMLDFEMPETELAVVSRQDAIQHGFLKPLRDWGMSVKYYQFGSTMGRDMLSIVIDTSNGKDQVPIPGPYDPIMEFKVLGDRLPKFKNNVKSDMATIGYPLDYISVKPVPGVSATSTEGGVILPNHGPQGLIVKETRLRGETFQSEMSQGMFRALAIVIHINYAVLSTVPSCIIIDDIGEGLDFEHSCALIELLLKKAKASHVQLIMSTNDRFVMNAVPIDSWSVLQQEAHRTKVYNYSNSKVAFDKFKITGLSNFNFLSSNFFEDAKNA